MDNKFYFTKRILDLEKNEAIFEYKLIFRDKKYNFSEKIILPKSLKPLNKTPETLDSLMKNLHLILGISYWKLTCAKELDLGDIKLSKPQAEFWNNVWENGLGEFFYINEINFNGLINFPYDESSRKEIIHFTKNDHEITNTSKSLLFFSGGKDSIVSAETLKHKKIDYTCLSVNPAPLVRECQKLTEAPSLIVERQIDTQLYTLNQERSFFNGHVPFNAILAFIAALVSYLYGFTNLITSNEDSSNYPNTVYLNKNINHQWSKSFEFEKMFNNYIKETLPNLNYFSILREMTEFEIGERLSKYTKYLNDFSSCNRNFKIKDKNYMTANSNIWCGNCPKCLFSFIIFAVFLEREKVIEIFKENLLDKYELVKYLREFLGIDVKPFECVGTPEEVKLALLKISDSKNFNDSILMSYFISEILPTINIENLEKEVLNKKVENLIPEEFKI